MVSYTPRLGLSKPDGPEYQNIAVLNGDFDTLDSSVGVRMVNANQIPPDTQLYDGLLVNERNTGKTWVASKNAGGTYDRAWIRYPWYLYSTSQIFQNWANGTARNMAMTWSSGVNSSATDIASGYIRIPIQGAYMLSIYSSWQNSAVNVGSIDITYQTGPDTAHLANAPFTDKRSPSTTPFLTVTTFPAMLYGAGTLLIPRMYNGTSQQADNVYCHAVLQLLGPTGINNS
jgi:hypothetical protein